MKVATLDHSVGLSKRADDSFNGHCGCGCSRLIHLLFDWICSDAVLLAVQLLGTGEHGLRRVPVQADDAEQGPSGVGRLRSREPGPFTKDVLSQMGVHLHASRSSVPGGQETRQIGTQSARLPGASLLGRPPARGKNCLFLK